MRRSIGVVLVRQVEILPPSYDSCNGLHYLFNPGAYEADKAAVLVRAALGNMKPIQ